VIAGLREAGSSTRVIVGGAPFRLDASLYKEVDADGTAVHVRDIIGLITQLVEEVQ
jgi:methanogenic corrinoid protein MtbC1